MAEFDSEDAILSAARLLRARDGIRLEAYTPYRVEGMREALGHSRTRLARAVFWAGLAGAGVGYAMQWWTSAVDFPLDSGGRPPHSAPAFVPIAFELTVLFAALTAFLAAILRSGLPRLWQPVFEIEGFERASIDRFWLKVGVHAADQPELAQELTRAGALRVVEAGGLR